MKLLLDSCTFIWLSVEPERLSAHSRGVIGEAGHELFLSAVSVAELAIKHSTGRLRVVDPPAIAFPRFRSKHGVRELPLDERAALFLAQLPLIHKDPFDRLLVCQAAVHGMTILTPDPQIRQYPCLTAW